MAREFPLVPVKVQTIKTKYRKISGYIPNKETVKKLERLRDAEPVSMRGQAPVIWDRAVGANVFDAYGNMWLDFSSGVLITNAGHGNKKIAEAIIEQAGKPLLTTYCFPNEPRIALVQKLVELSPKKLNKVFLLSTGAESTECSIKLMRTYGRRNFGDHKSIIISFENAFHGRTLGAQQIGGVPSGKAWIKNLDPEILQVPFPDGFRCAVTSFEFFEKRLETLGVKNENVAGVISETYQGGGASFMPKKYAAQLRKWCDRNNVLLCFDEVQAGFGRCGRQWGFELYGITPDLFCLGKGISSSLPISAVIGRQDVMNLYGPNEMTSTHSGNPVCAAAALANINAIIKNGLIGNSAKVGAVMHKKLGKIMKEFPEYVGACHGKGLVAGLHMTKKGSKDPDGDLAWNVVDQCFRMGLLMFAPVGFSGATVKIAPPLCIAEPAVEEGCSIIREAIERSI